jgi:predicted secreted protein
MKILILILAVFIFCNYTKAQEKTYSADQTTISVGVGETFYIKVESNRTTSYSWSVGEISDSAQVVVLGSQYTAPRTDVVGEGGEETWHFKTLSTGNVKLIWNYIRPWEKSEVPAKTITFNVEVK